MAVTPDFSESVIPSLLAYVIPSLLACVIPSLLACVIPGLTRDPSLHKHGCRLKFGMTSGF